MSEIQQLPGSSLARFDPSLSAPCLERPPGATRTAGHLVTRMQADVDRFRPLAPDRPRVLAPAKGFAKDVVEHAASEALGDVASKARLASSAAVRVAGTGALVGGAALAAAGPILLLGKFTANQLEASREGRVLAERAVAARGYCDRLAEELLRPQGTCVRDAASPRSRAEARQLDRGLGDIYTRAADAGARFAAQLDPGEQKRLLDATGHRPGRATADLVKDLSLKLQGMVGR